MRGPLGRLSSASPSRSTAKTDAPARYRDEAMASPIPLPAPVTSATFPSNLSFIGSSHLGV